MKGVVLVLLGVISGCGARTIDAGDDFADDAAIVEDSATTTSDTGVSVPGSDAEVPPVEDTGGVVTVDAGPASRPIECGRSTCDSAKQDCCVSMGAEATCVAKGSCRGVSLSCTSAASCGAGQQCCLNPRPPPSATCKASCGTGPGGGEIPLCNSNDDCPAGTRCRRLDGGLRGCIRG